MKIQPVAKPATKVTLLEVRPKVAAVGRSLPGALLSAARPIAVHDEEQDDFDAEMKRDKRRSRTLHAAQEGL